MGWITRRPGWPLVVSLTLAALALPISLRLAITTELVDLLPGNLPAVVSLREFDRDVGGHTFLSILIESPDTDANRRFGAALAERLEGRPWTYQVQLRREAGFFRARWPFLVSTAAITEIDRELTEAIGRAKVRQSPLAIDLDEAPAAGWDQARDALARHARDPFRDYNENDAGTMLLIQVQLREMTTRVAKTAQILREADGDITALRPASFHPALRARLFGGLCYRVFEYRAIVSDLIRASIVTFPVMLVVPALLFRSARAPLVVLVPVAVGMTVTYACAFALFGTLNLVTSFLFFVIYGIGDDYPIHLFSRAREEGAAGQVPDEAMRRAVRLTASPLFFSAVTDVVGFCALGWMRFRGFSQFGIISAIGVILVLVATFSCVPGLVQLLGLTRQQTDRLRPRPVPVLPVRKTSPAVGVLTVPWLLAAVWMAAVAASVAVNVSRLRFEDDFQRLRPDFPELNELEAKAATITGFRKATPAVFHTSDFEASRALTRQVQSRVDAAGDDSPVGQVLSLAGFLGSDTPERRATLGHMLTLLNDPVMAKAPADVRGEMNRYFGALDPSPLTLDAVPRSLRHSLTRAVSTSNGLCETFLVVAEPRDRLSIARNATAFSAQLGGIMIDGHPVVPAGEGLIVAEIIGLVRKEAPVVLLLALGGVALLLFAAFRSLRHTLLLTIALASSLSLTMAALAILGMRLHFFNVLVLPIVAGIGVDYGIHVLHRAREQRVTASEAARSVARPILAGASTTVAGFTGLMVARHPGLWSMGFTAVVGIAITALICLVFLPAIVDVTASRRRAS